MSRWASRVDVIFVPEASYASWENWTVGASEASWIKDANQASIKMTAKKHISWISNEQWSSMASGASEYKGYKN